MMIYTLVPPKFQLYNPVLPNQAHIAATKSVTSPFREFHWVPMIKLSMECSGPLLERLIPFIMIGPPAVAS